MQQTLHLEITVGASSSEYSLWKTGKEVKGKNGAFNHSKGGLRTSSRLPSESTNIGFIERAHPPNQEFG